jgi:hypothetical protein
MSCFSADSDCLLRPDALHLIAENLADPSVSGVVGLLDADIGYADFPSQYKNLWMHYTYLRLPRRVGVFLYKRRCCSHVGVQSGRRTRRQLHRR